ncbi:MAG: methyltransferase domain-containing protein [Verrucomicrobiota bacterium]
MNFPAISDASAMINFPRARALERDALLELVDLQSGQTVLDIQAAGGFLSDEVDRLLEQDVHCVCIEPCELLGGRLNSRYQWLRDSVEQFESVEDGSVDVALGLAGLHHSGCHADTIKACQRVLKPGGELAICDVEKGAAIADWLNVFVDRHNPSGHVGNFLNFGDTASLLRDAGLIDVVEEKKRVPWKFEKKEQVAVFFKGLFALDLELEQVDEAIGEYFDLQYSDEGVALDWQLIYCYGRKTRDGE